MKRTASAAWTGGLKDGKGTMTTSSGVLQDTRYSFSTRFENGAGSNPEELIAAAHAGCFSMAFSGQLGNAGFNPTRIHTTARVHIERGEGGFNITRIDLDTEGQVPGIDNAKFQELAEVAKKGCPVSKAL